MSGTGSSSSFMDTLKDVAGIGAGLGAVAGGVAPFVLKTDTPKYEAQGTTLAELEAEAAAEAEQQRKDRLRRQGIASTVRTTPLGAKADVKGITFGVSS